jgi:hypothetical protein
MQPGTAAMSLSSISWYRESKNPVISSIRGAI